MKSILAVKDKARWLRRRANQLKLDLAYHQRSIWVPGLPRLLMIEPTNLCNLRCPLCPTGNRALQRPKGRMPIDLYRAVLRELDGAIERLLLYNYGEPFLHPHIFEMITLASQAEVHTRVSTNGLVFEDARHIDELITSRLDHLRVSVDGATPEIHRVYRDGSRLETILEGVERLVKRQRVLGRKRPEVELQFIVMRHNEHELPAMRALAKSLGVPLRVKSVGLGSLVGAPGEEIKARSPEEVQGSRRWLPVGIDAPRRYDQRDGLLVVAKNGNGRKVCDHPWQRLVINWDGETTACCYDHEGQFAFGNAAQGIALLWNGPKLQDLRRALLRGDPPNPCRGCSVELWNTPRMAVVELPA